MKESPVAIARALHAALEAGASGEQLRGFFTLDASTIEHPNILKPGGATTALDDMLSNSVAGAQLLAHQRYELVDAIADGDLAILRLLWKGTVARDVGQFRAGQELRAHIAQFVSIQGGRISRIETYDCYEPFSTPQIRTADNM